MLKFLHANGFPTYIALSTDIINSRIIGASIIGGTIYLVDTKSWLIVKEDLTVEDFNYLAIGQTITFDPQYAMLQISSDKFAQVTASEFHYKVHTDSLYTFSYLETGIASNGTAVIGISTGASELHLGMVFSSSANGKVEIYYGSVAFTGGNVITSQNHNYNVSIAPLVVFNLNPTISSAGTLRYQSLITGGTGGNATGGSTEFPFSRELRFPANVQAYVKYTNLDGNSAMFNCIGDFYEL